MRAIASCLPLLFLSLSGCARKLPGPLECRALALASVQLEPSVPANLLAQNPRLEAKVEQVTRECLTTPWDYQLVNCLSGGDSTRVCLRDFEARRAGLASGQ